MKSGLIAFGIIFLVLGGIAYLYPFQTVSSSSFNIPAIWSYAFLIIGFLFLLFGLVIPGHGKGVVGPRGPRGSRGRVVRRSTKRKYRRLPRGTTVTTTKTTRTRR